MPQLAELSRLKRLRLRSSSLLKRAGYRGRLQTSKSARSCPVHPCEPKKSISLWRRNISLQSGIRHTKFPLLEPMRKPMVKSALTPRPCYGVVPYWAVAIVGIAIAPVALAALSWHAQAAESRRCLSGEEQRAVIASGRTVPLASAIHALHRLPKDVIKAQICQEPDRLVYVLTLLARDGKVKREIVDATSGAVVGER